MHDRQYSYLTLPGGLRCVHCHAPGLAEVCGVVIDAGSADEQPGEEGLAHFVEHTIFKGTSHRRAWHIINRMEAVGGEINAFTTKESTTIYATSPRGNSARALELVADLVCNATFPQREIDRERDVVADEIESYLDIPSEAIFDDIDEIVFAGTPLAHNILGTRSSIATFDSAKCRQWVETHYRADRMTVFYSGHLSPKRFFAMASHLFESLADRPSGATRQQIDLSRLPGPQSVGRAIDTHQAHTVMAAHIGSMTDPQRHATELLTNIVGGPGMNSLLNLALRERRGLVYTVDASTTLYTSTGLFAIYFGCDSCDTSRCSALVGDIMRRLASQPMSDLALRRAKRQYLGHVALARENTENAAIAMGRQTLYYGHASTMADIVRAVDHITPEQIAEAASKLSADDFTTLTFNPK